MRHREIGRRYIAGTGNYAGYDDSIALRIIEYIVENNLDEGFTALDLSANSLNIFSYLNEGTDKILIIDTAKMGKSPGDYMFFNPDDVLTKKKLGTFTTHEGDMIKTISLAKELNYYMPAIAFMGIEPEVIKNEFGLSDTLKARLTEYVTAAINKIGVSL